MNINQATTKLAALKKLNDGLEYCVTLSPMTGNFRVEEKTADQKEIDIGNGATANQRVNDFLNDLYKAAQS